MKLSQKFMKARRQIASGVLALSLTACVASSADAYLFDPDGSGSLSAINIGALDWGPTSFLAVGGDTAIANFISSGGTCTTSCDFTVLTQAKLIGVLDGAGNGLPTPTGLNTTFEITMVASLVERVTGVGTIGTLTGAAFTTQSTGFLNVFFDTAVNANQLTGSGFNDGRLILTGSLVQSGVTGSFNVDTSKPNVALDNTGANDYTGQLTVQGSGSQPSIPIDSLLRDPTFFTQLLTAFGIEFANISTGLPFDSADPMTCFDATATAATIGTNTVGDQNCFNQTHVNGLYSAQVLGANGGVIPNVGGTNGLFAPAGGPDFIAQTDFNSPLRVAAVPEPASFLLLGAGLLGMGRFVRRNRKSEK